MNRAIDAVVFDIGNVLVGWEPETYYDNRIGPDRRRRFFAAVPIYEANADLDRGAPFRPTIESLARRFPEWGDEIRLWHDDWVSMVTPVLHDSVATLLALKARGIPVFALSNFGRETFFIAQGAFPFLQAFDQLYISGQLELLKPEPGIYAALEAGCGVAPQRLLFTDDRPENIAAAQARGWQTHLFTGAAGWAERLRREGLLPQQETTA